MKTRCSRNRIGTLGLITLLIALAVVVPPPAIPAAAATNGTITEYPVPTGGSKFSLPGITTGADGNVWFTETSNRIGRMTPNGTIAEFSIPTANSDPQGIAAGPDGNLWFTEYLSNSIGQITTGGVVTEFSIPTVNSSPLGIAAGPDSNLWFTESGSNNIGRITPGGTVTEFPASTPNSLPVAISAGPDGNVWFTEANANKIGRITPSGVVTEFSIPTAGSLPQGITAGPDGNLWFTETNGNQIGQITTSGVITEFPIPTANSAPEGITAGADGNLWFPEFKADKIGRITPGGSISEFSVPTAGSEPFAITAGPDGNVWFTEFSAIQIGRVELAPTVQLSPTNLTFGSQPAGTASAPQTVTVSNTGGRALQVTSVSYSGAHPADFTTASDTCTGASVPVGGSCTIGVSFTPTAAGSRSATLVLTDNADNVAGSVQTVALSGTGAASADLAISIGATPNPVTVGKALTYAITVSNSGPTGASGVVVSDTLPSQSQFVSAHPSQGSCATPAKGATGTLTCSLGTVANGSVSMTSVVVTIIAPHKTTVYDTASVTSSTFDPNATNNSATVAVLTK